MTNALKTLVPSTDAVAGLNHWLGESLTQKAWDLLAAFAIILIGWWLSRWVVKLLDRTLVRFHVDAILRSFLRNAASAVLLVVVFIAALQAFGVPTTSLLAMLGAAGLAIGLALKDSLSNIASGVMLILLRPFKADDAVKIADIEGIVEQVRIFTTHLRTYQNESIHIPNSQITANPIVNLTGKPVRRADIAVGIDYGDRIDRARDVLLRIAAANDKVLETPASDVLVTGLGESSVDLVLRAWIRTADFVQTRSDLIEAVHREFAAAGLTIPFPQRDLHVYHSDADGRPLAEVLMASVQDDGDRPDPAPRPR